MYGCLPPKIDVRDYKLSKSCMKSQLPQEYSLDNLPKVKNQKQVGSCVAHATSSILEAHDLCIGDNHLSTNFIYGIQKQLCGHEGSGMYLRDACKIVKEYGDMLEEHCQGNHEVPQCWDIAETSLKCKEYKNIASNFQIKSYFNCCSNEEVKKAIYTYGPVLASIKWYDSYKVDKQGVLFGAEIGDYGYHAIMIYGWNQDGFLCQNSWGINWGNQGRFVLPYSIHIAEAKGIVDAVSDSRDIVKPKKNKILNIIYKIINVILNYLKKR